MKIDLRGKRALVTGASSGIGRALALALAKSGVELAISARRAQALTALADEIAAAGGKRPVVLTADLSLRGEAAELGQRAIAALGHVDILVNNAGVGVGGSQVNVGDGDDARTLFETNYWSALALTSALTPGMRERGQGTIVNVSSIGAITPMPLAGHYSSSKAALSLASETLRLELRGTGVHVFLVLPGPVETAMLNEFRQVPGGDKVLDGMPRGTTDVLAKKIVRGIQKQKQALVYPGILAVARHFPTLAVAVGSRVVKGVDVNDPRTMLGGSAGDPSLREAREAYEKRLSA